MEISKSLDMVEAVKLIFARTLRLMQKLAYSRDALEFK